MEYKRFDIDGGIFQDILPDGAKLYAGLKLPEIEFKKDKVKYTVTDLRPLNENAIYTLETILGAVLSNPDTNEVSFGIEMDKCEYDKIELIIDILVAVRYSAKKGGKYGWKKDGNFLVSGARVESIDDIEVITFELIKSHADAIRECAEEKPEPSFLELVIAVANSWEI